MADDGDYPLNCVDDAGDGFSGWFAISNPRRCDDFCYWRPPPGGGDSPDDAAWKPADPHRSAVARTPYGDAHWTCAYDGAGDETKASSVVGESWIDSRHRFSRPGGGGGADDDDDAPFPYLRCQKGAGERLKTLPGEAVKSAAFWEGWIAVASLVYVGEAFLFFVWRRGKRLRYEQIELGSVSVASEIGGDGFAEDASSLQIGELELEGDGRPNSISGNVNAMSDEAEGTSFLMKLSFVRQQAVSPRCKYCAPLTSVVSAGFKDKRKFFFVARILLVVAVNLLMAFTIAFSALSLMEIHHSPHFKESMETLTPACSANTFLCQAGNVDIDRESAHWPPLEGGSVNQLGTESSNVGRMENTNNTSRSNPAPDEYDGTMRPFSYIIASDAQLYWFAGEFAEMGEQALPPSCSPSDSCGRCTGKHGLNSNLRWRAAWENLMNGTTDGWNASQDWPIPNTLVMNGDLTAYFHPHEKRAYDSVYGNIEGLQYYFPSMGNHDIEHGAGAMYGGDEWIGPNNCNMEHAMTYFKSGFCSEIPGFHTDR
ncbi:hypothetical protein ACHAWF_018990 [Thalassiosira exigua]